ncbi:MAG: 1,4-dihydroxy-2-naphthoate octaprenyltransferase [Muribaculaceae bacterium]|nr:1,4-dihydroxy-2-naphthoate octaprenyltransferase [Muribaculaceae bacterium]
MTAGHPSALRCWIEAMRLRTLPVSVAGVVFAAGLSVCTARVSVCALMLCLAFAVLAQISSNFANEYYDYRDGLDKAGRVGPRRGVTEGDLTPRAMKMATFLTLGVACAIGCITVWLYGRPWMYAAGVAIAIGAMAYSTGPWPLSRHGLGELAVICFFGIVPVSLTYILATGVWEWRVMIYALAIGLMGANVLIVNNYRDRDDDKAVGKNTLAVMLGRKVTAFIYVANGFIAALLTMPAWMERSAWGWTVPALYLILHFAVSHRLTLRTGTALNPLLGITAMLMLVYSIAFLIFSVSVL